MAIFTHEDGRIVGSITLNSVQGSIALEFSHDTLGDRTVIVDGSKLTRGSESIQIPAEGLSSNGWSYDGIRILGDTLAIGTTTGSTTAGLITEFGEFHNAGHVTIIPRAIYGKIDIEGTIKDGGLFISHAFAITDVSPVGAGVVFGGTSTSTTRSTIVPARDADGDQSVVTSTGSTQLRAGTGTGLITDPNILFLHEVSVPAAGLSAYQVTLPEPAQTGTTPTVTVLAGTGITTAAVTFPTAGNRSLIQFNIANAGAVTIDADLEIVFETSQPESHLVVLDAFNNGANLVLGAGESIEMVGSSIAITS